MALQCPVIALVGSSGAIAAVREVLGGLPADLKAAVIVLIHLDPSRPSLLPAILGRVAELRVREAVTGRRLEPGVVDVAPSGCHLLVAPDGACTLIPSGAVPPHRPSADLLLTTLAMAAGPRAIAVVLSGHGHDGATGATAVHERGGTVLATDAATSEVFDMPRATIDRDAIIDRVVPLEELADVLAALVRTGPALPP